MASNWKRIDSSHCITHISDADLCIYAREYKAGGGFSAGESNQLILNFKKDGTKKKFTAEWEYRDMAVEQFAQEFVENIPASLDASISAIPSATHQAEESYSNRFEDLLSRIVELRPNLKVEWPVSAKSSVLAAHNNGSRDPSIIAQNYEFNGFSGGDPHTLVILDDVITTGGHYRAITDFLRANGFEGFIIGFFWARVI